MIKDNNTGRATGFFSRGREKFDAIPAFKHYESKTEADIDSARQANNLDADIELIWQANSADIDALEDAKTTLEAIKKINPGVYDQIIDGSLALIYKALGMSYGDSMDRVFDKARGKK